MRYSKYLTNNYFMRYSIYLTNQISMIYLKYLMLGKCVRYLNVNQSPVPADPCTIR